MNRMGNKRPRHLTVRRKPHHRRGYYTKSGKYVPPTQVRGSKPFQIEDRGKPGRTPEEDQWFESERKLNYAGQQWHAKSAPAKRRRILNKLVERDGYRAVVNRLNALANVTTYASVRRAAHEDMDYLKRKYRSE